MFLQVISVDNSRQQTTSTNVLIGYCHAHGDRLDARVHRRQTRPSARRAESRRPPLAAGNSAPSLASASHVTSAGPLPLTPDITVSVSLIAQRSQSLTLSTHRHRAMRRVLTERSAHDLGR